MRGLKVPLNGSEIRELVGLAGRSPKAAELAPAIYKRLMTLGLIVEAHNGLELTEIGRQRADRELEAARRPRLIVPAPSDRDRSSGVQE